ncbi:MAG: acyl-CoA dehydrogenase family protein [Solirubrobacterales bacterium]
MDFNLTDEQRLISESAREFADREIIPRARDSDRAGRFDREPAGELGGVGCTVYGLIVEQVGRAATGINAMLPLGTG